MIMYDDLGLNDTLPKSGITFKGFCITLFKLIILFLILLIFLKGFVNTGEVISEDVVDLSNISAPIQYDTSGSTKTKIKDGIADITYIAKYSISGRVIDVEKYSWYSVQDELSPMDVGIAWGFLATDEVQSKLQWTSLGNRYLSWYTSDVSWINGYGGKEKFKEHWSNNHLIPSDNKVKKLIKRIKKDDYVKITGYLVNINWKNDSGKYFYWNTSTSRADSGNGACEVIYVTDVKWLK